MSRPGDRELQFISTPVLWWLAPKDFLSALSHFPVAGPMRVKQSKEGGYVPKDAALREQLIRLLDGGHAHATFDSAVRGFPLERVGVRPKGIPYSAWELLEHMRIAQNDILRFSQSADHVSPAWPAGYWPVTAAPERESHWARSARVIRKDLAEFQALLRDPAQDLHRKFPWGDGQTLLREALLIADHNSYHIGQLVLVRRMLGAWPK